MMDESSAGLRPVDLRLQLAAGACQCRRSAGKILPLVTVRADGVGHRGPLPFPAAQGRSEHAGPHDDAPVIGSRLAHVDVDAADAHLSLADFEHNLVAAFVQNGIPGAPAQHVGNVIEAARPTTGS